MALPMPKPTLLLTSLAAMSSESTEKDPVARALFQTPEREDDGKSQNKQSPKPINMESGSKSLRTKWKV